MLNLDVLIAFFQWLMGAERQEPQAMYIPIEEERRDNDY